MKEYSQINERYDGFDWAKIAKWGCESMEASENLE